MSYTDLSDEAKLEQAIKFVAIGQPMPRELAKFLMENKLYDLITDPEGKNVKTGY